MRSSFRPWGSGCLFLTARGQTRCTLRPSCLHGGSVLVVSRSACTRPPARGRGTAERSLPPGRKPPRRPLGVTLHSGFWLGPQQRGAQLAPEGRKCHLPGALVAEGSRSGPPAGTAPELRRVLPPSLSDLPARVFREMVLPGHREHWTRPGHALPSPPLLTQAPQPLDRTPPLPSQPQTPGTLPSGLPAPTLQSVTRGPVCLDLQLPGLLPRGPAAAPALAAPLTPPA